MAGSSPSRSTAASESGRSARRRGPDSWQGVSEWYCGAVGRLGHYYHRQTILPGSLRLLDLKPDSSVLDLACGQGVLARHLPAGVGYVGVDMAPALIEQARRLDKNRQHRYVVADATQELPIEKFDFTHATVILSLQNVAEPQGLVENARRHLRKHGRLLIVVNHPCFRIPRQSRWGIDDDSKTEYRRVDRYLSPLEVPITVNPGRGRESKVVWSYHLPLSGYSRLLFRNGFVVERLEEWVSEKRSTGQAARMENRARQEFPLFLAILARTG